jgi:hypothetical protein
VTLERFKRRICKYKNHDNKSRHYVPFSDFHFFLSVFFPRGFLPTEIEINSSKINRFFKAKGEEEFEPYKKYKAYKIEREVQVSCANNFFKGYPR